MLTEKECNEALTRLLRPYFAKADVQNVYHKINKGYSIDEDSNLLMLLIIEHFNNPPLKFEELKEDMWVWDNKEKEFIKCQLGKNRLGNDCVIYDWDISPDEEFEEYYLEFEENHFYRKEVKE